MFNRTLALAVAPALLGLSVFGVVRCPGWYWLGAFAQQGQMETAAPANPLELGAAVAFAALFVATSVASSWAVQQFGTAGSTLWR